ncbi:MAG TPA: hypothetical protein VKM94_04125 [Blastocatellia bacterium]|nr:hypothetical protein [Blastocatellia bacterium]
MFTTIISPVFNASSRRGTPTELVRDSTSLPAVAPVVFEGSRRIFDRAHSMFLVMSVKQIFGSTFQHPRVEAIKVWFISPGGSFVDSQKLPDEYAVNSEEEGKDQPDGQKNYAVAQFGLLQQGYNADHDAKHGDGDDDQRPDGGLDGLVERLELIGCLPEVQIRAAASAIAQFLCGAA